MTQVINIRDAPPGWETNPDYVYIGRAGKGQDGYFGNPHRVRPSEAIGTTLTLYRAQLRGRFTIDEEFARRFRELDGKILVCFCKPNPCHGDVIVAFLDEIRG